VHELAVGPEADGQRLDVFLAVPLGSRAQAQRAIEEGRVRVDGQPAAKRRRLRPGERVVVDEAFAQEAAIVLPEVPVAFEDDDVLVADKPPGLIVHPGSGPSVATLVAVLAGRIAGGDDPTRPGVVHRLDRDTSGLIVLARNDVAHAALSEQIASRAVTREYLALVRGRPDAQTGTIDAPLGRDRRMRTRMSTDSDEARPAVTRFAIESGHGDATLLRIRLETGRTHQIRAHLKAIGHPVLGDPEYGIAGARGLPRQFLHATHLAFAHPRSGAPVALTSPLPPDLEAALG
jgi:23S rRNA pseudouridine1911/1915/1917 synthase